MSLILSVNQLGPTLKIFETLTPLLLRSNHNISLTQQRNIESSAKKSAALGVTRKSSRVRSSNSTQEPSETRSEKILESEQWPILQSWNVPWDWKITLFVMMPYLMSIIFTGVMESTGLGGFLPPISKNAQPPLQNIDEAAIQLFMDQLLKSVVKLSILYVLVSPYQPFPKDIVTYRWDQPFNLQKGWFLWGVGGLAVASGSVFLVKLFMSGSSAAQMQNEVDSLQRLLPFIGASDLRELFFSTAAIIAVLGVMAPLCEETIYRGFLMTSLTKWLPVNASLLVSSVAFTLAHHSPGKSLEIFIFGMVLGLVYAQTRNLLAPITMHACWNLGVIFTLLYSQSQGYDIQNYVG